MELSIAKQLIKNAEITSKELFDEISETALYNQEKVLNSFFKNKVNYSHFNPTTGYGYDDIGRDNLNRIFADVFGAEDALVSPLIANGTHALTLALFGLLRPGDLLYSIAGKPYDTLDDVINGEGNGSLKEFGIKYIYTDFYDSGFDLEAIKQVLTEQDPKVVFIQRSKGYLWREALSIEAIAAIIGFIRNLKPDVIIMVDNCYGEFTEKKEPCEVGADLAVGSLIKNPGGGIAPTGGYIVGRKSVIEQISYRLTAPSLGSEVGSYAAGYRLFYQGLFMAPSVVSNVLKFNVVASKVLTECGCKTMPESGKRPYDIINSVKFDTATELIEFCRIIQSVSPIDSYVTPEPWDMPGYPHQVIMAAGTFVQGSSLELTADGTVREPFVAYLQGGLTYEHCILALEKVLSKMF